MLFIYRFNHGKCGGCNLVIFALLLGDFSWNVENFNNILVVLLINRDISLTIPARISSGFNFKIRIKWPLPQLVCLYFLIQGWFQSLFDYDILKYSFMGEFNLLLVIWKFLIIINCVVIEIRVHINTAWSSMDRWFHSRCIQRTIRIYFSFLF